MKHAIAELEKALHTAETNEPIHRAEGNYLQATITAERAAELRAAIRILEAVDSVKEEWSGESEPEQPTTIRGWLETLPDGYRERALANMDHRFAAVDSINMGLALIEAFTWCDSPEGHSFWSSIADDGVFPPLPEPA
jgi:hypothetical protein